MKGRQCEIKKGTWTPEEDMKLLSYINKYGIWNWNRMAEYAGLSRTGKSCRLRWVNYLNPDIKRGNFTKEEDEIIINMHKMMGTRWFAIAASLPGRIDNEIKNHWHTHLKKRSLSNNLLDGSMESQKDTTLNFDYSNEETLDEVNSIPLTAPQGCEVPILVSNIPLTLGGDNIHKTEGNIISSFEITGDPYVSFWRESFPLEDVYMEDLHAAAYVYPGFELPMARDWDYDAASLYDYRFELLSLEDLDGLMIDSNF